MEYFAGGITVCARVPGSSLSRHLESGVDPGNEVGDIITIRELKQQTFLSSRTSDCRGGLDRQRRFWREILMLSRTRSPTQTALFCLCFLTGILDS